jgi:hypothetical protein
MLVRIGDPAPGTGGLKFANRYFDLFAINQLNEVAFRGYLCCGAYREGIFLAGPPRLRFPNSDFDEAGDGELPTRWSRFAGTSDGAYATRYDSGGADSWTGSSALRLHVSSSGGTVAVQSEPVNVTTGTEYLVTSRMRYQFRSGDQVARFSLVQYDAAGNEVGTQSVEGRAGDNLWTWQPNILRVRIAEKAATVRVRIELKSDRDCYLDVDTIR